MNRQSRDLHAGLPGRGLDLLPRLTFVGLLQNPVQMDGAARAEGCEGVWEEFEGGVGEVEDDPVDGRDGPEDLPRIPLMDEDPICSIRGDIRVQELDGGRVRVGGMHLSRTSSSCDEDRIRSNARERIRDNLAFLHKVGNPRAFRAEARAEIRASQVDVVPQAVLEVDRGRARLSRENFDRSNPVFSRDSTILDGGADFRIPLQDRPPNLSSIRPKFLRDLDDRDVADDVERTRKAMSQFRGNRDDVLVALNCHVSDSEFRFVRGESDLDSARGRNEQVVSVLGNAEMFSEDPLFEQRPTNLLATISRDNDAPRLHSVTMPRGVLRVFASSDNLHC